MNFSDCLSPSAVCLDARINSQKKLLEKIAELLSKATPELDMQTVFEHLNAREKLGSTALGQAVAVPHCRMQSIHRPVTAVLRIMPGIDYGAPDDQKVALFFALLVPEKAPETHLQILAQLAARLQNKAWIEALMMAPNVDSFINKLQEETKQQA